MKRPSRIFARILAPTAAGTAIGLLMASAPLSALPLTGSDPTGAAALAQNASRAPLILAQAECEGEDCPPAEQAPAAEPKQEQQAEPKAEPQPAPEPEPQAAPEPQPKPEAAPQPEPRPEAAPEPKPEPKAAAQPEPEAAPRSEPESIPEPEPAPRPAPAEAVPAVPQPEASPPADEQQAPQAEPAPEPRPAPELEPAPQPEAAPPAAPSQEAEPQAKRPSAKKPAAEQPVREQGQSAPQAEPAEPDAAPILDSQKEEEPADQGTKRKRPDREQAGQPPAPVDQGPPPESDAAATEAAQPRRIEAVTQERGKRRERAPDDNRRNRERPEGVDILREIGDRIIVGIGSQMMVESNDRPRMSRDAREVYYEDLPRGRTRETIVRDNGVQVVTIRDRYGDVIRRSRIMPDGREYVLAYVDEDNFDRVREWRDPGLDLPPMRLNIPRREYILESEYAQGPDDYYEFLERPPVERVQRLYSVDEVKRSARVRDIARRVDLDTLTFEFGSASIPESEIRRLEGVAEAMERLLDKNPAETFLIEGHTDAVGSDVANLALSDRRAEAVAEALTNVFAIPPENLATQGYGERYLKVKTQEPERENRRVAIRRITPLVAPVASAR